MSILLEHRKNVTKPIFVYTRKNKNELIRSLSKYAQPDYRKALWQISNTIVPYLILWTIMIYSALQGYHWLALLLTIPAAGLLVRIFIFFHDCCHNAFFASSRANRYLGYITGIMTFTAFDDWRRTHIIHHATSGNLDKRGIGDIWTMTVNEYKKASKFKRFVYRAFRNPLILFIFVPIILFLIVQRFASKGAGKRERLGLLYCNLALLTFAGIMIYSIGLGAYLLIQLPIIFLASSVGMWMFYMQHQYKDAYWVNSNHWDLIKSGLFGSSYYKLPKVLQWITGNIGLHHIHHIRANIPNYHLQQCYNEVPALQSVNIMNIRRSIKSMFLNLWDEELQKLVSFRSIVPATPG